MEIKNTTMNLMSEKSQVLSSKRAKSIGDLLEDVEVLIDTHFFDVFSETKSPLFL